MTTNMVSRQVHLASRPRGAATLDNFEVVDVPVPEPAEGQVVVRNEYMSVDPYMRGRMNDTASYIAPFGIGEALEGGAVGEVVESRSADIPVGDIVVHNQGWRDIAIVNGSEVAPAATPASANLGVLGMPGLTAYVGLLQIASMQSGDTVFISGAAGAVGSTVGQIAKLRGAERVVGSAGSDEKIDYLVNTLDFDAAFNYHDGSVAEQLAAAAPAGIDVYFDNVGGEHLEAAISALRVNGRVAMCGAISQYNATAPSPGPANLMMLIGKRLSLKGFIVSDHWDMRPAFLEEAGAWLADGQLHNRETILEGIDNAPQAFIGLMEGSNVGKMLVRVGGSS